MAKQPKTDPGLLSKKAKAQKDDAPALALWDEIWDLDRAPAIKVVQDRRGCSQEDAAFIVACFAAGNGKRGRAAAKAKRPTTLVQQLRDMRVPNKAALRTRAENGDAAAQHILDNYGNKQISNAFFGMTR